MLFPRETPIPDRKKNKGMSCISIFKPRNPREIAAQLTRPVTMVARGGRNGGERCGEIEPLSWGLSFVFMSERIEWFAVTLPPICPRLCHRQTKRKGRKWLGTRERQCPGPWLRGRLREGAGHGDCPGRAATRAHPLAGLHGERHAAAQMAVRPRPDVDGSRVGDQCRAGVQPHCAARLLAAGSADAGRPPPPCKFHPPAPLGRAKTAQNRRNSPLDTLLPAWQYGPLCVRAKNHSPSPAQRP